MKHRFQNQPLHRKLTVIIIVTTVAAMLMASVAIVAYEVLSFRDFMVSELENTADVIGANGAAAIRFEVPRDAEATLTSLKAKPHVRGACFFDENGDVFAAYSRDGGELVMPPMPLVEGITFTSNYVISVKHIYQDDDFIGSIHIIADLDLFYRLLERSIIVTAVIIILCSGLALLISLRVLRVIARPIETLVDTANEVSVSKDYSLRAVKFADDDLGNLTEEFNDMLGQIQLRDEEMEQRVEERTQQISHANKMLTDSLTEKVVLLKEIHHRVKNNMQIISSLLSLQTRQVTDPVIVEMFQNSRNRIRAMASIHERLYQSDDLAKVDFAQYLKGLADYLFQSYKISPQDIRFHSEVEDVSLDLDHAIPCGLMINELVSNCLKYAYPAGRKGEIRVRLTQSEKGYTLEVADDGIGFPAEVDFRASESLGLQLINTLVSQLHGSIEMQNHLGTQFMIEFPGDKLDIAVDAGR
jgi:two-component sensor histidine kinase